MKKRIAFLSFAAALAFCYSCSNDETIASQATNESNEINFRPLMTGVTRAADIDATTLETTGFYVSATKHSDNSAYFTDVAYTAYENVSGTKTWTSPDKQYWPSDDSELDFYAYSPKATGEGHNTQITAHSTYKTFTVQPSTTISEQVDLIFANTNQKKKSTDKTGVVLNFRHTGAKIVCKVKNTSTSLVFGVEGWKVGYLSPSGTFTYADSNTDGKNTGSGTTLTFGQWGSWAAASIATEYSSTFSKVDIAAKVVSPENVHETTLSGEMILVPQTLTKATDYASTANEAKLNGSFIAVKLYILNNTNSDLVAGGGSTASPSTIWAIWPIGGYSWEPGKKYTYTIDLADGGYYEQNNDDGSDDLIPLIDGSEIKFVDVTVDNWTDVAKAVPES